MAESVEELTERLQRWYLPHLARELSSLREWFLDIQALFPATYPELESGGPMSRTARLHGDLSIIAGAVEATVDAIHIAASGAEAEGGRTETVPSAGDEGERKEEWTVPEIAGVVRHLAWERPQLLGGALWALCKSAELSKLCRTSEPAPQVVADLALSSRMARGLIRASHRGRQILKTAPPGRQEPSTQRLERRIEQLEELMDSPGVPEAVRPVVERICRAALQLATSTLRMQEAEREMTRGLGDLLAEGHVSMEILLATLARPEDIS